MCAEFYPDEPVSQIRPLCFTSFRLTGYLYPPSHTAHPHRGANPAKQRQQPQPPPTYIGLGSHVLATIPRMQWLMTVFADGDE